MKPAPKKRKLKITANSQHSSVFKRGIVLFHKWLVGTGGAERLAIEEYRYFVRSGIPTRLLTFEAAPGALFGLDPKCVEVIQRKSEFDGILQLRRRLAELNPDLIILAGGLRDFYFANLFLNIPYILHQHEAPYKLICHDRQILVPLICFRAAKALKETAYGYRMIPVPPPAISLARKVRMEVLYFVEYLALKKAAEVTLLSKRAVREVNLLHGRDAKALAGCLPEKIFSHQPKPEFKEKLGLHGRRVLMSVCRLDPLKRLDVIIQAFARIAWNFEDTVLVIGGTGPHEAILKNLAAQLGLAPRIIFLGFVPDDELWDTMAACDVFLCADWTDFDIAPYEALALGRRAIWSSEMETDEFLERTGAVFVAEPSIDGLAEGMNRALLAPAIDRVGLNDFLQKFTWDNYFSQVLDLGAEVVKGMLFHAIELAQLKASFSEFFAQ